MLEDPLAVSFKETMRKGRKLNNRRTRKGSYRPLRNLLDLGKHKFLQLIRALGIRRRLVVILATIIENQLGVPDEILRRRVQVLLVLLLHGAQVHRLLDHLVVIRHLVAVDRLRERPRRPVVLHIVEQVQELVVIRAVSRLARQLVHIWRPAGLANGQDVHGVKFAGAGFLPFFGRGVHNVGFGEGSDFGVDGFFLLQEHAACFEVADAGHHGALHDGAAFVVFDVAHPAGFVEGDFFGEALLFEVADGVVVGVGEEVLDGRGGFDVVFEVRHHVCAVAFDLLVRGDGAEDNFGKLAVREGAVGYASGSLMINC